MKPVSLRPRFLLILVRLLPAGMLALSVLFNAAVPPSAQAASPAGMALRPVLAPGDPPSNASAADKLQGIIISLIKGTLSLILLTAGAVLAVNFAKGAFEAQLSNLLNSPQGVSHAYLNLISAAISGGLTLLSPLLVNSFVDALVGNSISVHIPMPTINFF
jgi:hypothetical protein